MVKQTQRFDIFLSYAHLDANKVKRLVQRLKADGFCLWIDEEQIGGGDPLRKVMVEGIKNSAHIFICLSANYFKSKWAAFESAVNQAMDPDNLERRLVPIKIESCKIPEEYAWLYCPDLTSEIDWPKEYAKVIKNLRGTRAKIGDIRRQSSAFALGEQSEVEYLLCSLKSKRVDVNDEIIRNAYEYLWQLCSKAELSGKSIVRLNGEPYISHPVSVAKSLVNLGMDSETVVAGLLHDTIEDFGEGLGVTATFLINRFGESVFQLVDGVTNVRDSYGHTDHLESVIKLFKAAIKDPRILIIKLADRLHNMSTLEGWNVEPQKQAQIARITRSLYVPVADQLGFWDIKRDLEDACFKYLENADYDRIFRRTLQMREHPSSQQLLREIRSLLQTKLDRSLGKDVSRTIWRHRHLYSIYRREESNDLDLDSVFDLESLRLVVKDEKRWYDALYVVDQVFPYYFSFRRIQKAPPNEYRAFHTKVIGRAGRRITIHICTEEAAKLGDLGLATYYHPEWGKDKNLARVGCLGRLMKISEEPPENFLLALREDVFFKDIIFVNSPVGEMVYDMRRGDTLAEFAERVRPRTASRISMATINGRETKLSARLEDGQVVHIDWE